jgi:hypothetical protein
MLQLEPVRDSQPEPVRDSMVAAGPDDHEEVLEESVGR